MVTEGILMSTVKSQIRYSIYNTFNNRWLTSEPYGVNIWNSALKEIETTVSEHTAILLLNVLNKKDIISTETLPLLLIVPITTSVKYHEYSSTIENIKYEPDFLSAVSVKNFI